MNLARSSFIRVRQDNEFRPGKDAMVVEDLGDGTVGLTFGFDRHNQFQDVACVGTELWNKSELDLSTYDP